MSKTEQNIQVQESHHAFFFIPDMSGFTRFMSNASTNYSQQIITHLLTAMVKSNALGLEMAEIQGDAVLFYRLGKPPTIRQAVRQCNKTFIDFGHEIKALARIYNETETQFASLENLGLKIIIHYGKCSIADIEGLKKLMGTDVIIANRLLKNSVKGSEYLLLTDYYLATQKKEQIDKVLTWSKLQSGFEELTHIGQVPYKYISLQPWKKAISNLTSIH